MRRKVEIIRNLLNEYFPSPEIPLQHKDPFTLLIAVLLSAQCTDSRVNQVTPHLFALGDTPHALANVPVATIEEVIRTCGLAKTKAKAISSLSKLLIEHHHGEVPKTFEELEALPGVGHKTASVVMCQAFKIPAFPVDTHIHRLAKRWGLSKGKTVVETEKDLKRLFPKEEWIKLHLQIIYYARKFCKARGHTINECPICSALMNLPSR